MIEFAHAISMKLLNINMFLMCNDVDSTVRLFSAIIFIYIEILLTSRQRSINQKQCQE